MKAIPIPIDGPEYEAERARRHREQFGAIEARRREDEQLLRSLSGDEFENLRQRALSFMRGRAPDYLNYTIKKNGEDPFENRTIFNAMIAELKSTGVMA